MNRENTVWVIERRSSDTNYMPYEAKMTRDLARERQKSLVKTQKTFKFRVAKYTTDSPECAKYDSSTSDW